MREIIITLALLLVAAGLVSLYTKGDASNKTAALTWIQVNIDWWLD